MEIVSSENEICDSRVGEYKKICLLIGVFNVICYVLRIAANFVAVQLNPVITEVGGTDAFAISLLLSSIFLQILPSIIGAAMFGFWRKESLKSFYRPPKNNTKALAFFPTVYGVGMTTNLLTILVSFLITSVFDVQKVVNPVEQIAPTDINNALVMFVFVAIVAPIFEEFVFRGVILNALKPFGNGVAIFASALMFGAFHANFSQCFYAVAIGIVLGYISCATGSIFPTTILHALVNSISGIMIIIMTLPGVKKVMSGTSSALSESEMIQCNIAGFFTAAVLITALIGLILAIKKLINIKKFKLPQVWNEINLQKKLRFLLINPAMIISIVMIIDVFTNDILTRIVCGII